MDEKSVKTAVSRQLMEHRLPAWDELPDFELYMDQVLSLCSRYLEGMPNPEGSKLTASMINNYVKVKIVPAPQGKRYSRRHVAYLLLLCVLKPILPIAAIQQLFTAAQNSGNEEELYGRFCELYRQASCAAAGDQCFAETELSDAVIYAALRARGEQSAALALLGALTPDEDDKQRKH